MVAGAEVQGRPSQRPDGAGSDFLPCRARAGLGNARWRLLLPMGEGNGVSETRRSRISRHLGGKRGGDLTPGTCRGFPGTPILSSPTLRQILRGPQHSPQATAQPSTSYLSSSGLRAGGKFHLSVSAHPGLAPSCLLLLALPPARPPSPNPLSFSVAQ